MKVTNLRKKVGAALLAAGMITPAVAFANSHVPNMIVNGSFEDVEAGPLGSYFTQPLNGWLDGSQVGSTYQYEQDYDRPFNFDGDNNPAHNPPSPGLRYFNANYPDHDRCKTDCDPNHGRDDPHHVGVNLDTNARGLVMQDLDLTGLGGREYKISGWFGSISGQFDDPATFEVLFFSSHGGPTGIAQVTGYANDHDPDPNNILVDAGDWNRQTDVGVIPAGTTRAEASVYSTGVGHRYVDLARFAIVPEPSSVLLAGLGILGMGVGSQLRKRKA